MEPKLQLVLVLLLVLELLQLVLMEQILIGVVLAAEAAGMAEASAAGALVQVAQDSYGLMLRKEVCHLVICQQVNII